MRNWAGRARVAGGNWVTVELIRFLSRVGMVRGIRNEERKKRGLVSVECFSHQNVDFVRVVG